MIALRHCVFVAHRRLTVTFGSLARLRKRRIVRVVVVQHRLVALVHLHVDVAVVEGQVADDLGGALLDRVQRDDVGQQRRGTLRQHRADVVDQPGLVDEGLAEQQVRTSTSSVVGGIRLSTSAAAGRWYSGTLERQRDLDPGLVDLQPDGGGPTAEPERGRLDLAHQVEDAAVLQPAPGRRGTGAAARRSAGRCAAHARQPRTSRDGFPGAQSASIVVERSDAAQQLGQLVLTRLGEQEVVERLEAAPLVGLRDLGAAADQLGQQFALGSVPGRRSSRVRLGRVAGSSPRPPGSPKEARAPSTVNCW